jgi:hypothetical protein
MRNSIPDLPQPKRGAARRKENAQKGVRKKGKIEFAVESGPLTLIKKTMKALYKEITRRTTISLTAWRLRMEDHGGIDLGVKGPHIGTLAAKGVKERGLINRDNTEISQNMMSLDTASMTRK